MTRSYSILGKSAGQAKGIPSSETLRQPIPGEGRSWAGKGGAGDPCKYFDFY